MDLKDKLKTLYLSHMYRLAIGICSKPVLTIHNGNKAKNTQTSGYIELSNDEMNTIIMETRIKSSSNISPI
jgi:hypothetical protein